MPPDPDAAVETVYRSDWGRILATLIRLVGEFEVAEGVGVTGRGWHRGRIRGTISGGVATCFEERSFSVLS
jgi:hypothetical protein